MLPSLSWTMQDENRHVVVYLDKLAKWDGHYTIAAREHKVSLS